MESKNTHNITMGAQFACVVTLVVMVFVTVYVWMEFRSKRIEAFAISPLPSASCEKLLPDEYAQQYRNRILKATPVTHPELDHSQYHYCYMRDFDMNNTPQYAPICDAEKSPVYANSMVQRVFQTDVKDLDSQLGIPRRVCMMEIQPDRINVKNLADFYRDVQRIENPLLGKELQECKTSKVLLDKANIELRSQLAQHSNQLKSMNTVIEEEAMLMQAKQAELQLALLQPRSTAEGKVFVIDDKGNIIITSDSTSEHDMNEFKGTIYAIILPQVPNAFAVSVYDMTNTPKIIKQTVAAMGLPSIYVSRITVQKLGSP